MSLTNRARLNRSPQAAAESTPLRKTQPVGMGDGSRYGSEAVGFYGDYNGVIYPFRYTGGMIQFSGPEGIADGYRMPFLSHDHKDAQNYLGQIVGHVSDFARYLLSHASVDHEELTDGLENLIDNVAIQNSKNIHRMIFRTEYDLRRIYDSFLWHLAIHNIYEKVPKRAIGLNDGTMNEEGKTILTPREKFMVRTFCDDGYADETGDNKNNIPAEFFDNHGTRWYLVPPPESYTNVTRIYINKAIWLWNCRVFGYSARQAVELFRILYDAQSKTIPFERVLEKIAAAGLKPAEVDFGSISKIITSLLSGTDLTAIINRYGTEFCTGILNLVRDLWLLKIFSYVRNSVSWEDWTWECKYVLFNESTPDDIQFNQLMKLLKEGWDRTQLKVPTGSLAPKYTARILPITSDKSVGYKIHLNQGDQADVIQHDSKEYTAYPCVCWSEVDFTKMLDKANKNPGTGIEHPVRYQAVELFSLTEAQGEELVVYNRITGEIDGIISKQTVTGRFEMVYPVSLKKLKRITVGLEFEARHDPLILQFMESISAPITVGSFADLDMIGQQTLYGPNYYLSGLTSLRGRAHNDIVDFSNYKDTDPEPLFWQIFKNILISIQERENIGVLGEKAEVDPIEEAIVKVKAGNAKLAQPRNELGRFE